MKIKELLKFYYKKSHYLLNCFQWYLFFILYRFRLKRTKNFNHANCKQILGGKILLIAPHADDELLSSYSLFKNNKTVSVYYCGFTGSNSSESNKIIRYGEITNACNQLQAPLIAGDGSSDSLCKAIIEGCFDTVIIPSIVDWHPQHRLVSYNLLEAINNHNLQISLYSYSVTVPNESSKEIIYVPLSRNEQDAKYVLFGKVYYSQSFMPLYRFRINERINGVNSCSYAAEAFLKHSIPEWKCAVERIMKQESEKGSPFMSLAEELKTNLGDLKRIRTLSRKMYMILETENS